MSNFVATAKKRVPPLVPGWHHWSLRWGRTSPPAPSACSGLWCATGSRGASWSDSCYDGSKRGRITEAGKVADGATAILLQRLNQTRFGLQKGHKSVDNLEGAERQTCLCVLADIWWFQTTTNPIFPFNFSKVELSRQHQDLQNHPPLCANRPFCSVSWYTFSRGGKWQTLQVLWLNWMDFFWVKLWRLQWVLNEHVEVFSIPHVNKCGIIWTRYRHCWI